MRQLIRGEVGEVDSALSRGGGMTNMFIAYIIMKLFKRDIYELSSEENAITGAKIRGRVRKFCLQEEINIILDNTVDIEGGVRFGILSGENTEKIETFLKSIVNDIVIILVLEDTVNPVLSKLNVNDETRYNIE